MNMSFELKVTLLPHLTHIKEQTQLFFNTKYVKNEVLDNE